MFLLDNLPGHIHHFIMDLYTKHEIPGLLLTNANIITLDPILPEASWVAIGNGKIVDSGISDKYKKYNLSKKKIIDCSGKTVLPGFIDSHMHLMSLAGSFVTIDLKPDGGINSISDIQSKIIALSKKMPKGTWVRGKGYNEFHLAEKRHPNRFDLDKASLDNPVKLSHRSGHAHVLNTIALKLIGITEDTPDPPGGIIERETESGIPTGLLYEMGNYLNSRIPLLENELIEKGVKLADNNLISAGITSIQDASSENNINRIYFLKECKEKGILRPRLNMMFGTTCFNEMKSAVLPHSDCDQLQVNCVKIILDETTGQLYPSQDELDKLVLQIHASGMQCAIHAIEENAIESACLALERAVKSSPGQNHRHRIEHCSVCPPSLAKRISDLGIRVVTQPIFIYKSGDRYLETVEPQKRKHLYPLATLLKAGVITAAGSDSPVAPLNPMPAIYAAITRKSETGKSVAGNKKIKVLEALRMYTASGADVSFSENIKGSISPGKLADIIILSDDPLKVPPDRIKDIKIEMTIIGGEIVWNDGL